MPNVKPNYRRLILVTPLLVALVLSSALGCCMRKLQTAQTSFNQATQSQVIGTPLTPAQRTQYQNAVTQAEAALAVCKRNDLKVSAYAIIAFAKWRLGDSAGAISAANAGRSLYESAKLTTNQRDYAMLLLTSGFVLQSQAHQEYRNRLEAKRGYMSPAEARQISQKMDKALDDIDAATARLDKSNPALDYAYQQQLLIISDQINLWTMLVKDEKDYAPEVRRAIQRGREIAKKLPPGDPKAQEMLKSFNETEQALPL